MQFTANYVEPMNVKANINVVHPPLFCYSVFNLRVQSNRQTVNGETLRKSLMFSNEIFIPFTIVIAGKINTNTAKWILYASVD